MEEKELLEIKAREWEQMGRQFKRALTATDKSIGARSSLVT
jgi:hypothetical protein